jgi:cytochrome b561
MISDSTSRYGTVSRVLHWGMALCLLWMFGSILGADLTDDRAVQTWLRNSHKHVGSLIWVLVLLRAGWALLQARRRPPAISTAARLGHVALYALMFVIPSIGLLRQYGSGRAFSPLGLPVFPGFDPSQKIDVLVKLGGALHGELAWVLLALIVGHVVMAFWHRRGGGQDVLPRMV